MFTVPDLGCKSAQARVRVRQGYSVLGHNCMRAFYRFHTQQQDPAFSVPKKLLKSIGLRTLKSMSFDTVHQCVSGLNSPAKPEF